MPSLLRTVSSWSEPGVPHGPNWERRLLQQLTLGGVSSFRSLYVQGSYFDNDIVLRAPALCGVEPVLRLPLPCPALPRIRRATR